jgi:predicted DCC family thiol-disulfide oxidoreductase YuxK
MEDMHVVTPEGLPYRGAEAWREIAWAAPPLFPVWLVLSIPFTMPLWQWGYSLIARNRYWLFGKTTDDCEDGACAVHFRPK